MNKLCNEYKQAISENKLKLYNIKLKTARLLMMFYLKKTYCEFLKIYI